MAMSIGKVNENNEESSDSGQNSFQINLDVLIPSCILKKTQWMVPKKCFHPLFLTMVSVGCRPGLNGSDSALVPGKTTLE